MKFLLPLLRNNLLQLSHANQLRYADTKNRTKTITLYMLIAMILMGLLAYLIYSLKIIYSIAWSLEEVVTELVVPMVLICVILNIAISIFWGSGLLLSCYPAFYLVLNHPTFNQIKKKHGINYSDRFYIRLLYAVSFVLSY